jgi:hypothetical protein
MASAKTSTSGGVTLYPAGQNGFSSAAIAKKQTVTAAAAPVQEKQHIAAHIDSDHYSSDGGESDYESDREPTQIGRQAAEPRGHVDSETVRRALDLPHVEKNAISVVVEVDTDISLEDLANGRNVISMNPRINQKFMKAVTDPATGNEILIGDPTRSQITRIQLLEYTNELPIAVGIDLDLKGGSAPKMTSGNNALSFPAILKKETSKVLAKKDCGGLLLFENLNALPEELFQQWGGVKLEDLTRGITPINGTQESTLDIDENKRIPDILHSNQLIFEREFPGFKYKHLVKDVKAGRRKACRVWNSVLQKAIDIGIQMALKPIAENTQDPSKLQLKLRSTTSENGGFSDLQSVMTRRLGADLAADAMNRTSTLSLTLRISALVAGTNAPAPAGRSQSAHDASPGVSDSEA